MKIVEYKELYGDIETIPWEISQLDEFVYLAPHLAFILDIYKIIPPKTVLNDFFQKGESNAGMSGAIVWKKFSITQEEYDLLSKTLCNDSKKKLSKDIFFQDEVSFAIWNEKIMQNFKRGLH